jgi:deazaflavin-dependent oxidoreductase (nitroreductase family)
MDPRIAAVLERGGVIDITTTGRRSGAPRRIEIVFHNIGGRLYISGTPGRPRDWLANLAAHPDFTFHLKNGVRADLKARARVIGDEAERRQIIPAVARAWRRDDVERMVADSPLVEVTIEPSDRAAGPDS